jgi:hypothetical protein
MCEGDTVTHYANQGPGFYYQWYHDGEEIAGATSPSLDIFEGGSYYVLVYSDSFCSKTSELINVVVNPAPNVVITAANDTLFSNYATGNQWYHNGYALVGQTNPYLVGYGGGNYTVKVIDANTGCMGVSQAYNINSVSNLTPVRNINVYPNPANQLVTIAWEAEKGNAVNISIADIFGKEVYKTQAVQSSKQEINLEQLVPGVYVINVNSGNWSKKIKLVRN